MDEDKVLALLRRILEFLRFQEYEAVLMTPANMEWRRRQLMNEIQEILLHE